MEISNIDEAILYENNGTKYIQGKIDTLPEQENTEERDPSINCLEDETEKAFTQNQRNISEKTNKYMATDRGRQ